MKNLYWFVGGFALAAVLSKWTLIAFLVKISWLALLWLVVAFCAVAILGLPVWLFMWTVKKICEKP